MENSTTKLFGEKLNSNTYEKKTGEKESKSVLESHKFVSSQKWLINVGKILISLEFLFQIQTLVYMYPKGFVPCVSGIFIKVK